MTSSNGAHPEHMSSADTVARVTLRPIGSPLPLGAFALVVCGLLVAGLQLQWFPVADGKSVGYLLIAFGFPLLALAGVLAFLGRDVLVGTGFSVFAVAWLSFGLVLLTGAPGATSPVTGVFFLGLGGIFVLLIGGGLFGGKVAAGAIILTGAARFVLSGLYELTSSTGVEHAAGILGLVFVGVAGYVGLATLLEDSARRTVLPIGRRGPARTALEGGLAAQLAELEHEAGVREQL